MHPFAGIFQGFYFKCSELIKQADLAPLQHLRQRQSAEILGGGISQAARVFQTQKALLRIIIDHKLKK